MASSAAEMKKHLKIYYMIFGALLVLTAVTVLVAGFEVGITGGIIIALIVAGVKGSLVACYFMHLLTERGLVLWVLALCALFFFLLLFLPMITSFDNPRALFVDSVSGQPIGN